MNLARAFLPAVVLINSCGPSYRAITRHDVYLIDGTASVVPASLDQTVRAIESAAEQFQRGDCVTVLPIISDSEAIPSEQIVRMCAPTERQPYDQDLRDFRNTFHEALAAQRGQIASHRASRTDILGSLRLVEQEFALDGPNVHKTLAIFSDFIEEDTTINFAKAPELATPEFAERLAARFSTTTITPRNRQTVEGMSVFLGNLESNEIESLPKQRREAIRRFWLAYFNDQHAHPFFATDGPGMSLKFLAQSE